jgi:hypothetical protein
MDVALRVGLCWVSRDEEEKNAVRGCRLRPRRREEELLRGHDGMLRAALPPLPPQLHSVCAVAVCVLAGCGARIAVCGGRGLATVGAPIANDSGQGGVGRIGVVCGLWKKCGGGLDVSLDGCGAVGKIAVGKFDERVAGMLELILIRTALSLSPAYRSGPDRRPLSLLPGK